MFALRDRLHLFCHHSVMAFTCAPARTGSPCHVQRWHGLPDTSFWLDIALKTTHHLKIVNSDLTSEYGRILNYEWSFFFCQSTLARRFKNTFNFYLSWKPRRSCLLASQRLQWATPLCKKLSVTYLVFNYAVVTRLLVRDQYLSLPQPPPHDSHRPASVHSLVSQQSTWQSTGRRCTWIGACA